MPRRQGKLPAEQHHETVFVSSALHLRMGILPRPPGFSDVLMFGTPFHDDIQLALIPSLRRPSRFPVIAHRMVGLTNPVKFSIFRSSSRAP